MHVLVARLRQLSAEPIKAQVRRPQCLHGELHQRIEPASLVVFRENEERSSRPYHPPNLSQVAEQVRPVVVDAQRAFQIDSNAACSQLHTLTMLPDFMTASSFLIMSPRRYQ